VRLFTIGFTKTSARDFFRRLKSAGVTRVVDTRLHKDSQLSGFAKRSDLPFFLSTIDQIDYQPADLLAPTADMLDAYRKKRIRWPEYERLYLDLLQSRHVEEHLEVNSFDHSCLLCSEATPEHCHRRLAAEYLSRVWNEVEIVHL